MRITKNKKESEFTYYFTKNNDKSYQFGELIKKISEVLGPEVNCMVNIEIIKLKDGDFDKDVNLQTR